MNHIYISLLFYSDLRRSPPATVKEEDEENSFPLSPSNEELPKWLQEASNMKKLRRRSTDNRSVGSNYLDSYLGNLTHHSWLTFAPSTPHHTSLYMPRRVYLYPDAYFRKEKSSKQQLFMSRSFTEGISDSAYESFSKTKPNTRVTPLSDDPDNIGTPSSDRTRHMTDSPPTDKSLSVLLNKTINEEVSGPLSTAGTESGKA